MAETAPTPDTVDLFERIAIPTEMQSTTTEANNSTPAEHTSNGTALQESTETMQSPDTTSLPQNSTVPDPTHIIPATEAIEKVESTAERPASQIPAANESEPVSLTITPSISVSETLPTRLQAMPVPSEPKTPRRFDGLTGFELPFDGESERKSGWRPVKRHATATFTGSQISDHASFTTRTGQLGSIPQSARLGTETEKVVYGGTLDRRERELDRRERELDRRERELERMERELERRRRDLDQDRARWETQTHLESYIQAVGQPQSNKVLPSREMFPAQWQSALESFKKSIQSQILVERQEAETALEARIMRRVGEELAKERKVHEVMQMSDQEVNELMEDTVGHWLRKDEDIADNIRFQSLLYLAQEKMATISGLQLPPDTDSGALAWRLAIGPSIITQERYTKAMNLLQDKELDDTAKGVVDSKAAMEFIVEWTSHLRKDEPFSPGRISRDEYLESVRRQVEKIHIDENAFVALIDFVIPV